MTKKILFALILIIVIGAGVAYFARNIIVERAIESSSNEALGVETDLSSATLSLSAASLSMDDFIVHNPDGFDDGDFVTLKHTAVSVEAGSILDDEVVVNSFVIDGVRIHLLQENQNGNYAVVMKNIKQASAEPSDKRLHIKRISVENIEVAAKLILMGETKYDKTFTIDNFAIDDVGGENGATIGEVAVQVLRPIITKAVAEGRKELPGDFGLSFDNVKQDALDRIGSEVSDRLKKLSGDSEDE